MKRLLSEPLLHFLALGATLFASFFLLERPDRPGDGKIVVSAGKIEHLAALFVRTRGRPPTRAELGELISDFVREEAAYREGLALGLDRDDTLIRRRIRQKLEFVAEDLARSVTPDDDELAAFLARHPERFRVSPWFAFRHVFLDPQRRGDSVEADARETLVTLNGGRPPDAASLGDRILLEHAYDGVSQRDVEALFGGRFAAALAEIEPGRWEGPIESAYGLHLVFVSERHEGRLPALDEVRDEVEREWLSERRVKMIDQFYGELLDRYEVVVEWPGNLSQGEGS